MVVDIKFSGLLRFGRSVCVSSSSPLLQVADRASVGATVVGRRWVLRWVMETTVQRSEDDGDGGRRRRQWLASVEETPLQGWWGGDEEDSEVAVGGRFAPMNEASSRAGWKAAFLVAEREGGQSWGMVVRGKKLVCEWQREMRGG